MKTIAAIAILAGGACLGGCSRQQTPAATTSSAPVSAAAAQAPAQASAAPAMSDEDAVRKAVEDHLQSNHGINLAAMDVNITSVTVNGDHAQAQADFKLKQGGTGMSMTYQLERHAGGWLVQQSQPGNGQFVHPPMDQTHAAPGSTSATPGAPAGSMPDVTDYMKQHPAKSQN